LHERLDALIRGTRGFRDRFARVEPIDRLYDVEGRDDGLRLVGLNVADEVLARGRKRGILLTRLLATSVKPAASASTTDSRGCLLVTPTSVMTAGSRPARRALSAILARSASIRSASEFGAPSARAPTAVFMSEGRSCKQSVIPIGGLLVSTTLNPFAIRPAELDSTTSNAFAIRPAEPRTFMEVEQGPLAP
jgi:hypothetical protein